LTSSSVVNNFLSVLTSSLELLTVPQERSGDHQVLVRGHLLAVVNFEGKSVYCLLVDVSASFMIINKADACSEGNLAPVLNLGELS